MEPIPDSTEMDPDGHKVVFENEHLRVLEVRSVSGQQLPTHSHPPRLVVAIRGYRIKSTDLAGNEFVIDRRAGEATWVEHEVHSAEVLIGPTHVIEVEVKGAG
jgi:hypothetical protein